jgi:hypothetical protein
VLPKGTYGRFPHAGGGDPFFEFFLFFLLFFGPLILARRKSD